MSSSVGDNALRRAFQSRSAGWLGRGVCEQFDGFAFFQAACGIETQLTVDASAARLDEAAHLVPRLAGQPLAQQGGEGQAGLLGGE